MLSVAVTEVRNNFKKYIDLVNDDVLELHIIRERGRNAVLIGEDEWDSIQETLLVYENEQTLSEVRESIRQLDEGDTVTFDSLDELRGRRR